MKLKTIFIIFNTLIAISFIFVFLMPAFFLGWSYAGDFWGKNWYLGILFIGVLGLVNGYFWYNWTLFAALEEENWDDVVSVLRQRIFERKTFNNGNIRLLVNTWVVQGNIEGVRSIEELLRGKNTRALQKNALLLGIPHLLSNNGEEIVTYYSEFVPTASGTERDWLIWCQGFGLMLQESHGEAQQLLIDRSENATDVIVRALSAYLLEGYATSGAVDVSILEKTRSTLREKYSLSQWNREVERARADLYVLILGKLIRDVTAWVYGEQQ